MKYPHFLRSLTLLAFAVLSACVPSVNPLYTADTLVFRPELLGVWKEKPDSEDSWNFTKEGADAYSLLVQEKEASSAFAAHLLKLGDVYFLDLFPKEDQFENWKAGNLYRATFIPTHLILKLKLGKTLEVQMLNPDGLKELLTQDPKALTHALPEKDILVITAPTGELQKFFKKHAETRALWGDPTVLQKIQL